MDLVKGYCLTRNDDGTYFIEFNTTAPAKVTYNEGNTLEIVVEADAKGGKSFKTNNYKSVNGEFKYVFSQPDNTARRKNEPGGTTFP